MHQSVLDFGKNNLTYWVGWERVLEVGSRNVNGSLRDYIEPRCDEYIGIDMEAGKGVDIVMPAEDLTKRFGAEFDIVVCTEMLEHAEDWRTAINQMKSVLSPDGLILITTRGPGFPYHEYPGDHWRYTVNNMREIFRDFKIDVCVPDPDPNSPGVFLIATKPGDWEPCDLSGIELDKPLLR
jgi:SAM-dependent methyltransferase